MQNFDVDDYGMRLHTDIYCNSGAKHAFDEAVEYSLRKIKGRICVGLMNQVKLNDSPP